MNPTTPTHPRLGVNKNSFVHGIRAGCSGNNVVVVYVVFLQTTKWAFVCVRERRKKRENHPFWWESESEGRGEVVVCYNILFDFFSKGASLCSSTTTLRRAFLVVS